MPCLSFPLRLVLLACLAAFGLAFLAIRPAAAQAPLLPQFLGQVPAASLVEGADGYGPLRTDVPVVPVLRRGETIAFAYLTSDFVGTTGYSGKPIHVMVAIGPDAVLRGVKLVKHSEPIVLIGIPEAKVAAVTAGYKGLDIVKEGATGGRGHDLKIISGATVTIMVIDDSVVRSSLFVARALGLGGLSPQIAQTGPRYELDPDAKAGEDWFTLTGDGTVRRLSLDVGQVNRAFEGVADPRAAQRPEPGHDQDTFIDLYVTLASIPAIGKVMLEPGEHANLSEWLKEGEHAILVAARGRYSFKGSGYVRGGIFDRIQLVQGDISVRFRDRQHRRVGRVAVEGAPTFSEMDLFKIPAGTGFDPTQPFRLQLLVNREVGAIERVYTTFEMGWRPPAAFVRPVAAPGEPAKDASVQAREAAAGEAAAKTALWQRIWHDKRFEIAGLLAMLAVLTVAFFFQIFLTRSERATLWFRMSFLTVTLVFLGWYANAQLSIVNLMALANSLATGFSWDAFLLDPLTFILWFSVAAALLFWGRGAYCGWLCPFGALQELTNRVAKLFKVPQWTLPWGVHERLWPIKYMIFLGLFGVTLASLDQAERLAEVEPFKTAIVLKFDRAWPFLLYVGVLLGIGLFVERFYCRYLCPLGAALAIPARMRMFDWLKRYRECGNPCKTCANECMVQAIHPTGEINPNECLNCMHCQVLYQSETKCPVVALRRKKREAFERLSSSPPAAARRAPVSST
jgi:NosR/NirI family nitrous oxide reductase transcriptional regulator